MSMMQGILDQLPSQHNNGYPEPHVYMTALAAVMEAGIGQETDTSGSCDRAAWKGRQLRQ